ncbi:MAG: 50S ribosomal protein L19 [bacterium]
MSIIQDVEKSFMKKEIPAFNVGDTVRVFSKIVEGDKERLQAFEGTVIKKRGRGIGEVVTVRKVVQEVGIEKTFPLHSPRVDKIKVIKSGRTRRAKLYYLRGRIGSKALKIEEAVTEKTVPAEAAASKPAATPDK